MEKIKFDVNNLFAKKEVLISEDVIKQIAYFAIQSGIVKFELMDFETQDICFPQAGLCNKGRRMRFVNTEAYVNII